MTPEEQLLDELLDESKPGSINQTIKVFPDINRINKTKTSGREHRALLATIITRIKAWVVKLLSAKADLVDGKVPVGQLPELGNSINSTDDIATEGATNKWFTEARVIATRFTANLWSWIGLTSASDTISAKGWLDFLTNKAKTNEEQIALRVKQIKQGVTTYIPDASGLLLLPALTSGGPEDRTIVSSGAVTLTMDKDAFLKMTDGRLAGNLTLSFTGGVKGVEQVLTFEGNGSATVTFSNAAMEGGGHFKNGIGALNKLWLRVGQDKTGAVAYFYLWV